MKKVIEQGLIGLSNAGTFFGEEHPTDVLIMDKLK